MEALTTRLSTKGQVILPADLRKKHGWQPGQVLEVQETAEGVLLKAAEVFPRTTLEQVAGMLSSPDGPNLTIEEMNLAILAEVQERHKRGEF